MLAAVPTLYTARYANRTLIEHPGAKVRITLGYPRFRLSYQLAGKIPELAPTREMFGRSQAEFRALYTTLLLQRGGPPTIAKRLNAVATEAGVDSLVLLCFEDLRKPDAFCHRRVFAEWFEAHTEQPVLELAEDRP